MWYDLVLFIHHLEFCIIFFIFDCMTHLLVRTWPFPIGLKNTGLHRSILYCFYVPIYFHFHLAWPGLAFWFFRRNRYHHLDVLKSRKAPRFAKNERALPLYWVRPTPTPHSNMHGISGGLKGAVSRQSSSFCLFLPVTRPQLLRKEITCKWHKQRFETNKYVSWTLFLKLQTAEINFEKLLGWTAFKNSNFNPFPSSSVLPIRGICCICCVILTFL